MKRIYYFIILASLLIALIPTIVYSYPSTTEKQNIQQMINRGDPLRQAYQQAVNITNEAIDKWDAAGQPRTGPLINQARARLNDENNAKAALQANRDSVIHAVDSLYDTGIPAGTDIKYDPECKDRGYNTDKCFIRICEPGIAGGPDRLAGTKIHEWEHQKQKNAGRWGPGNVPPDTSFLRAQLEFEADEAILNADNGNKIKLTIEQKLEILNRKAGNLKHMLDALEAEWKQKSVGVQPGGVVREEVTIINNSDTPQLFNCIITDSLGWPIVPQMFTVPLYPEQESTLEVFVHVPPMTEIGTINELFCYAQTEDDTSFDFTMINVVPTVDVVAEADTHGLRGQIIEASYTVTNQGELPDIFHVTITNPLGWPVESFFDISLDIGGDSSFSVPIIIPMDVPLWTTNLISCEATSLSNPMYHDKDWLGIRVDEIDIRPMFIQAPIGTYPAGSIVTPKVTVYNDGYVESFFDVYFEVNLPVPHRDSVLNLMLPPDHLIDVEFAYVNLPQAGLYPIEFYSYAHMDANPYNDTINGTFMVEPAVHTGWCQKESLPTGVTGKYAKDGGASVPVGFFEPGSDPFYGIFVFRGNRSKEFYEYYSDADTWSRPNALESIPWLYKPGTTTPIKKYPSNGAALCYDGDHTIYATKSGGTREFWAYDINHNSWTMKETLPPLKGVKGGTSMVFKDGKVYLLAGNRPKPDSNNFYAYTPSTHSWEILDTLPPGPYNRVWKDGSCLTLYNDTIYALKGSDKQGYFYKYDGSIWTLLDSIPKVDTLKRAAPPVRLKTTNKTPKDGASIASGDGKIYIIKGGGSTALWKYDVGSGFSMSTDDTIPRLNARSYAKTGASLAYANGTLYLLKGNNTPEFWSYTPSEIATLSLTMTKGENGIMAKPSGIIYPFLLYQSMPNPFQSQTAIRYSLPAQSNVSLMIYDISGKQVKTLVDQYQTSGLYSINWNGENNQGRKVGQGIYFYVLKTDNDKMQKKMLMLR